MTLIPDQRNKRSQPEKPNRPDKRINKMASREGCWIPQRQKRNLDSRQKPPSKKD